eukprot:gene6361-2990_t
MEVPTRAQVEKGLRRFVSWLPPPSRIQDSGRRVVNDVVQTLQQAAATSSRFRVARSCVAGSFGTTVHPVWDIDLVFFVGFREGDSSPPFHEVLRAFEDALKHRFRDDVQIHCTTKIALKVKLKDFELDILAAPDLTKGDLIASGPAWAQRRALLMKLESLETLDARTRVPLHSSRNNQNVYLCPFAESVIAFFKKQSEFVHAVVRLCKVWSRGLNFGKRPPSLSYVVELVATRSAQCVEVEGGRQKLVDVFKHFLRALYEYHSLNIVWFEQYSASDVDPALLSHRPLLLEPSNPFNNLFQKWGPEHFEDLGEFAANTLRRTEQVDLTRIRDLSIMDLSINGIRELCNKLSINDWDQRPEQQAVLALMRQLFEVQFSQAAIAPLGQAFGSYKNKINATWLVGTIIDPQIVMAQSGMPYVLPSKQTDTIYKITDFLTSLLAVQGLSSLATGRDVHQDTQDVINKFRATVFAGSTPARQTGRDPGRQICVVVPLRYTLAVSVAFDLR